MSQNKQVIILNGYARAGKDTFCNYLNKYIPTIHYSSVTLVKEVAKSIGWNGEKTEKDRKFLSDLKILLTEYNDAPFEDLEKKYQEFMEEDNDAKLLVLDIREPEEIERAKIAFNAISIFIKNDNVKQITSNSADANAQNCDYDCIVDNSGTLVELKYKAKDIVNIIQSMFQYEDKNYVIEFPEKEGVIFEIYQLHPSTTFKLFCAIEKYIPDIKTRE